MFKSESRSLRRHHAKRLKKKRRDYRTAFNERNLVKVVNTPKPCSCFMCGNPRRYYGEKTIQEQKAEIETEV